MYRNPHRLPRRDFLTGSTAGVGWLLLPGALRAAPEGAPANNPAAHLKLAWTDSLQWAKVVDITQVPGKELTEKLAAAQASLAAKGGGVVYFPPGVYRFTESIKLKSGVVLRGADPSPVTRAHDEKYALATRFEFRKYEPSFEGEGTPVIRAFKALPLEDPATASHCGVVNLDINRGHVRFAEAEEHQGGSNRFVFGCILRNAAVPASSVPDATIGQHAWQRYTCGHLAAIDVKASANGLVANNRLPKSGEDNFTMNGYLLLDRKRQPKTMDGIVVDYDNRPAICLNHYGVGGAGGQGPDGTPETFPFAFRKGLVIRDNYTFNTGRCAIGFFGDGVECRTNVIRFAKEEWRPTVTGRHLSHGADTNDNRAVEMRGWRWVVDGNDYDVHRNWASDRAYRINDGEGLMHEDHVNSTVKDSVLTHNRGNTYLSICQTAGIDGLLVEGNDIRLREDRREPAIHVTANRTNDPFPCRNVKIINNTVAGGGILISGSPAQNNIVEGNQALGSAPRKIENQANAVVEDNENFTVDDTPWMSAKDRGKARQQKK
jgi:hypothetical protein